MTETFDVFIIGGGPAGQTLADKCAAGGMSVGIAEYRGYGGTCSLRGCDPKRILVTRTMALHDVENLQNRGLKGLPDFDWDATRHALSAIIDPRPQHAEVSLLESGIEVFTEQAKFVAPHELQVGEQRISAEHIVIATGQRPAPLEVPGAAFAKTSDDFHQLDTLPQRIVFIGGGYIGMETAHFCARAGCEVTIVNNDNDPLPMFDAELVDRFLDCTRGLGIKIIFNAKAKAIEQLLDGAGFGVSIEHKDGKIEQLHADLVMNTAGREPILDTLDLSAANIKAEKDGIPVDDYFRVKGSGRIYAIGDVALSDAPPLTPVANLEAEALAQTLLGNATKANYAGVAAVVYALPELATVGLTEAAANKKGQSFEVRTNVIADTKFKRHALRRTSLWL